MLKDEKSPSGATMEVSTRSGEPLFSSTAQAALTRIGMSSLSPCRMTLISPLWIFLVTENRRDREQDVFAYVAFIEKFLKNAGIVQPVLIGHSLGAAICLSFAIKYGDEAAAIVPVGGGVRMPVNPLILDGLKNNPTETIAAIAKFSITKANRERFATQLADAISRTKSETIHGDFTACNRLELTSAIKGIRIPTLVVCGAEDKMTPPALSEYLRDNIPGARLALIPAAGHFAMLENPNEFNITLTDFVNSLPKQSVES